jgi:hypothetical protein
MRCIEAMKARYGIIRGHISPEYNQEISTSEDFLSTSDDNIVRNKPFKERKINISMPEGVWD